MGRPRRTFVRSVAPPIRPRAALDRQLARRRRAIRSLGLIEPPHLVVGPPATLARRIARLDRWIGRELDLAGGKRFPAWEDEEGERGPDPRFPSR